MTTVVLLQDIVKIDREFREKLRTMFVFIPFNNIFSRELSFPFYYCL